MKMSLERAANSLSSLFGLGIVRQATLDRLRNSEIEFNSTKAKLSAAQQFVDFMEYFPPQYAPQFLDWKSRSRSQIKQDLFVLASLDFKADGYSVEFGATNGIDLSNTF